MKINFRPEIYLVIFIILLFPLYYFNLKSESVSQSNTDWKEAVWHFVDNKKPEYREIWFEEGDNIIGGTFVDNCWDFTSMWTGIKYKGCIGEKYSQGKIKLPPED